MAHKKKKQAKPPTEDVSQAPSTAVIEKPPNKAKAMVSTSKKKARIIVRNLPFNRLSEAEVLKVFKPFGNVLDVHLPKRDNGKFVGCGFVEFDAKLSAAKAIAHVNGQEMNGRPIVVDWALPKDTYVDKLRKELEGEVKVKEEPQNEDDAGDEMDSDVDEDHFAEVKPDVDDYDDDDDEENGDHDGEADDDDMDDEDMEDVKMEKPRKESNDVEEGKTVFLKNVPFSATNNDVKECAAAYGRVLYALVCVDKLTEHSKGTAFVKFSEKDSADKFINDSNKVHLNEQAIEVTRAVSRAKLAEEKKSNKKQVKDSRNLYLVREGVVMAGSPAAASLSPADMAKRLQIEQWKTQILRNLNMFVSRTRLVVHNIPSDYDDAKFRAMVAKYSQPNTPIKEARVMHDSKKYDGKGNPVSKEVGFVTFMSHDDALHLLRTINNNPAVFTESKRPIVSFSIENREILNLKLKRLERSRAKVLGDKAKDKIMTKSNRKQRRFLRRRENKIKKRQEAKQLKREGKLDAVDTKSKQVEVSKGPFDKKLGKMKLKKASKGAKIPNTVPQDIVNGKAKKTTVKRKSPVNSVVTPEKKMKTDHSAAADEFSGTQSVPGKQVKLRSRQKIKQQTEIFKNRQKEAKKLKKMQKGLKEKQQFRKEREPSSKKNSRNRKSGSDATDAKLAKMVASYRQKIENAATFKKWYDT